MTDAVITALSTLAPWATGGLVAVASFCRERSAVANEDFNNFRQIAAVTDPSQPLPAAFAFGAGGLLGYLLCSGLILLLSALNISMVNSLLALGLLITVASIWGIYQLFVAFNLTKTQPAPCRTTAYLFLFSCLVLSASLWRQNEAPAAAWDVLHFWAENATELIKVSEDLSGTTQFLNELGHPPLVIGILAWMGWSAEYLSHPIVFNPWILCLCSIALMTYGAAHYFTRQWSVSGVLAIVVMTTPLLENHSLQFGYAEIWVCASVLCAMCLIVFGLNQRRIGRTILGLAVTLFLPLIKNTGSLYALVLWSSTIIAVLLPSILVLYDRKSPIAKMMIVLLLGMLLIAGYLAIQLCIDNVCLSIGSYVISHNGYSFSDMLRNEIWSFFMNQSFSIIGLAFFLIAYNLIKKRALFPGMLASTVFTYCLIISLLMIPVLTQMMLYDTWLGKLYASPSNDTGNSRLTLPLVTVIPVYIAMVIRSTFQKSN